VTMMKFSRDIYKQTVLSRFYSLGGSTSVWHRGLCCPGASNCYCPGASAMYWFVVSVSVEDDGGDGLHRGCPTSPGADSYLSTGSSADNQPHSHCRVPCRLQLVKPLEGDCCSHGSDGLYCFRLSFYA